MKNEIIAQTAYLKSRRSFVCNEQKASVIEVYKLIIRGDLAMTKKKLPETIEECNAKMELTQKKIRQYENRNKMLDRKLVIEKRKERNHRLCSRGG